MVIAEMRAAHVPMEIFGFDVKGKYIRENRVHCAGDVLRRGRSKVSWCCQWCFASSQKFCRIFRVGFVIRCWFGASKHASTRCYRAAFHAPTISVIVKRGHCALVRLCATDKEILQALSFGASTTFSARSNGTTN